MILLEDALRYGGFCMLFLSGAFGVCAVRDYVRLGIRDALDDLSGKRRARGIEEMASLPSGGARRPREAPMLEQHEEYAGWQLPQEVSIDAQETLLEEAGAITCAVPGR